MAENDIITKSNGRPVINLTGQKFGRLIVIKEGAIKGRRRTWTCQCACGTIRDINQNSLRQGRSKSCGICESRQIIGQKFGRLTITKIDDSNSRITKRKYTYFLCLCECGNTCSIRRSELISGITVSCGCYRREKVTRHGKHKTPEWISWMNMIMRMTNPKDPHYPDYGARLKIDDFYRDFNNFFVDLGPMPRDGSKYSVGRIDNSVGYCRGNLRWETPTQQANNRRSNHFLTFQDRTLTIQQWTREFNFGNGLIWNRISQLGWSVEKALTTPVQRRDNVNNENFKSDSFALGYTCLTNK